MKRAAAVLLMLICVLAASSAGAADPAQVAGDLAGLAGQARQDAASMRSDMAAEERELRAELARLKKALAAVDQDLDAMDARLAALTAEREKLRERMARDQGDAAQAGAVLRSAAEDADKLLSGSPLAVERPEVRASLAPLLEGETHCDADRTAVLAEALFAEMNRGGALTAGDGQFLALDGRMVQGRVTRLGRLAAWYQLDGEAGFLRLDASGGRYVAVSGEPSWSLSGDLDDWAAGRGSDAVLDLSGGAVLARLEHGGGLAEWLAQGGLLVWPILLVGALAVLIVLERAWTLLRVPTDTGDLLPTLTGLLSKGLVEDGRRACAQEAESPVRRVLAAGLEQAGGSRDVLENAFHEAVLRELPRLERFLPTLAVLAAVAPLMGLLGTVTGMIETFRAITFFGDSDPGTLSGGISQALITTELGLAVAIPAMILHHFLERRVDRIVGDMEEKGVALTVTLLANGDGHGR